ncbi:transmembrane protein 273-like [Scomber scombrus]|uniref:Transmembrane protein 273-like n=1 Tax=Scomber scombrus TaxID=13677 RepID=A0AAV1NR78_SCOSC
MRAIQTRGCLSSFIRAVLITEYLLMSVRGDGEDSTEKLEIKYVLIGTGVGLFLLILFIIFKFCTIRKELRNSNCTDGSAKRASEPHMVTLSNLSQSEHPVAAVSNDTQC